MANDVEGAVRLADNLMGSGETGGAREVLRRAGERWPQSRPILVRRLEEHLRYKRWSEFDSLLADGVVRHPDSASLAVLEAQAREQREDFAGAARAYERAVALRPDDPEIWIRGARVLRADDRPRDSVDWVERALGLHANEAGLHASLGYACVALGDPLRAVRAFEEAQRLQPDWAPYQDDIAGALMLAERWSDAIAAAERSLQRVPASERAFTAIAISAQHLGDLPRAENAYLKAVDAARRPGRARGNFGLFLARQEGRSEEALPHLAAAHDMHPDWEEVAGALERARRTLRAAE